MKNLLTILVFIFPLFNYAQISVTNNNLPSSGDTFRFSNSNNLTITTTQTGANQTWDYTSLTPNSQGVDEYKSFLRTPYFFYSQFFGAIGLKTADTISLGIITITNVHTFYRKSSAAYTAEGTGFTTSGIPLASDYSNSDRVYKLPMQYNQHDSDDFRVATTVPSLGTFIQQGKRINHVDGWGKISTPYKSDVSCLRIKSDVLEIDSLKTQFISFGFPVNRREIKWLTNIEAQPMLEITGALLNNNFTPTLIKYRDSSRNVSQSNGFTPSVSFTVDKKNGNKNNDTFRFINTTTPSFGNSYSWSFTPNNANFVNGTNANSANPSVVFTENDIYSVNLNASRNGNSADTFEKDLITISDLNSLDPALNQGSILLLPNAVSDYISIQSTYVNKEIDIQVFSIAGQLMLEKTITNSENIAISFLPKGRYVLIAKTQGETVKLLFDKI